MKTLTSKEIRENMEEVVEAAQNGEEFLFIYRSKPAFKIVPVDQGQKKEQNSNFVLRDSGSGNKYNADSKMSKILKAVQGINNADDIGPPEQDKELLRKRILDKYNSIGN